MFKPDNQRRKHTVRATDRRYQRQLAAEELEDRRLLAGDLALYQNQLLHSDVNADGTVNVSDLTALIGSLRSGGPRSLSSGGAEGEPGSTTTATTSPLFIDVNGDNLLSLDDVTTVVGTIRGEAAPGDLTYRLELTVGGSVANTVGQNQMFRLNVYVQDTRDPVTTPGLNSETEKGLLTADLDVSFTENLVNAGAVQYNLADLNGVPYRFEEALPGTTTVIDSGGVGLIDNANGLRDNVFSSSDTIGFEEVLLFSADFTAGSTLGTVNFASGLDFANGSTNIVGNIFEIPGVQATAADINFGTAQIEIVAFTANAPVGVADSYSTNEDTQLDVSAPGNQSGDGITSPPVVGVLDNDTDADQPGTTLSALFVPGSATPGGGTVALDSDGTFTYTPAANFNGMFTFQYIATDGGRQSAPTTVTITVNSQPDPPVLSPDVYDTPLNTQLVTTDVDGTTTPTDSNDDSVLANDFDGDSADTVDPQTLRVVSYDSTSTHGGSVTMNPNGTFTYTPPSPSFIGVDKFDYTARSFIGGSPNLNEAPVTTNVEIRVGLDPRNVSGFVYADKNNNGLREAGEPGLGGVQVELTGMDFQSNPVNLVAFTDTSGHYQFVDVLPGTYTVHEIQPTVLFDGLDTIGTDANGVLTNLDAPATNDQFRFALTGVSNAVDINFGELGRKTEFFSLAEFLASSSGTNSLAAFGPGGTFEFVQLDPAEWPTIVSLTITLNGDGTATLNAVDTGMNALQTTVATNGDPRFQIVAQTTNGIVVRLAQQSAFFP